MSLIHDIRPGTSVKIIYRNAIHNNVNFNVEYVGCVASELLLFNLTSNRKSLHELKMLRPGLIMNISVIVGDDTLTMLKFSSDLIMVTTVQVPLLVVSYPKEIIQRRLRSEPRIKTELMANFIVCSTKSEHLALVTDISKSGIQCEYHPTEEELAEAQPQTLSRLIDEDVKIEFPPDEEHLEVTTIRGKIKNIRGREKLAVGIQFNQDDLALIKSFYALLLMKEHGL